jgi:predicted RNA-binding Zn-ribbon protein involved in translation (DUF1610 family)
MLKGIRRLLRNFFTRTSTLRNEPLNRVSLIVLIIVDLFILVNVFTGLGEISNWHLSPTQAYPCHSEWQNYRNAISQKLKHQDTEILRRTITTTRENKISFRQQNLDVGQRLGSVAELCLEYSDRQDKANNPLNQKAVAEIERFETKVNQLTATNQEIRSKYDSTLLEKIAKQNREQSINPVSAERALEEITKNDQSIANFNRQIASAKLILKANSESINFLQLLQDGKKFQAVDRGFLSASFWYPSIQIGLQALFLLPLIAIALFIYNLAQRKKYALVSLLSWHLLVILFIPLVIKIFEFLQFGAIAKFIFNLVSQIFGGLLFLISYVYIFLIPIVGFGLIKFSQRKVALNSKLQSSVRVQNSQCIQCARKIQANVNYCPHCGFNQNVECSNCHELTYKYLGYCKHCGTAQDSDS